MPFNRLTKRLNDKNRKQILRSDRFERMEINWRECIAMRKLRELVPYNQQTFRQHLYERAINIQKRRRDLRAKFQDERKANESIEDKILAFRQQYMNELRDLKAHGSKEEKQKATIYLKFIEERAETPKYVCLSCECLFFYYSMKKATPEEIDD